MGGLSNLGGSVFTLKVDDSKFTTALHEAEAEAGRASNAIGNQLVQGSKRAQMGFLQLGYMIDDMQYGFRSIVNNIPQVAMAIGGPNAMAIAGAAGIAGVAINLLIQHWGQLSAVWDESSNKIPQLSGSTEHLTGQIKKLDEEILKLTKDQINLNTLDLERLSILKRVSAEGHQYLTAEKEVSALQSDQERDMGHAFTKAVGKIPGGGDALVAMLVQNGMSVQAATEAVAGAAKGKGGALEAILPHVPGEAPYMDLFRATGEGVAREKKEKEDIKEAEAVQQREKQRTAERHRLEERLTQEGARFEEQGKREELENEKRDIQERLKRQEHMLTPEGRQQLQDKILGGASPGSASLLSAKAASDKLLIDSFNKVPEKQLKTLVGMHTTLKNIDTKLRALGLQ